MKFNLKDWISIFAIAVCIFVAVILYLPGWVCDDAFISFRYARNFAEGNGIVFNVGEKVEGYSNFLWVIIISFLYKNYDMPFWVSSRLLGAFFSVSTVLMLFYFTRQIVGRRSFLNLLPSSLLSFSTYFMHWTYSGLETTFFAFLFLLSVYFFIYEDENRIFPLSPVWMGIAALTRPEGALLFVCGFCLRVYSSIKSKKDLYTEIMSHIIWIMSFLLIFLPFIFWRLYYYGNLFPNTFYTKATGGGFYQLLQGGSYIWHFWSDIRGYIFFLLIPFIWLFFKRRGQLHRLLIISSYFLAYTFFILVVGGDWMTNYRFFAPLLPFIMFFFSIGIVEFIEFFNEYRYLKLVVCISVLFLLLSTPGFDYLRSLSATKPEEFKSRFFSVFERVRYYESENVKTGEWLRRNYPENSSIGLADIGKIPYFSGFKTIDFMGLIDPYISRLKGTLHSKIDVGYIMSKSPDFIILAMYPDLINGYPTDQAIFRDERFVYGYDFIKAFYNEAKTNPQRYLLFKRNDKKFSFTAYMELYKTIDGRDPKVLLLSENEKEELRRKITSSNLDEITKEAVDKWRSSFKSVFFSIPTRENNGIEFPLKVPVNAKLKFSIGLGNETWEPSKGDGVEFQVLVKKKVLSMPVKIFSHYIDPKNRSEDRKWHDFEVNLERFGGEDVVLILKNLPGRLGDSRFDNSLWGNPRIENVIPIFTQDSGLKNFK